MASPITTPSNTTDWFTSNTPELAQAPTYSIEDTLTWNKARTILTGGNVFISNASSGQTMVRGITLGFNQDFDPAAGMFNTTNFPGASSDQLTAARNTYAVLTGRVATVSSTAVLPARASMRARAEHARRRLQRLRRVRAGYVEAEAESHAHGRYPLRHPDAVHPVHERHVGGDDGQRLRTVGARRRRPLQQVRFWTLVPWAASHRITSCSRRGSEGYETDLNNFAPSAGIAWQPNVESGFLHKILGDPAQATNPRRILHGLRP